MVGKCGVILAGGTGTRLRPLTLTLNKHLVGVYNKQMIFYPIETLRDQFGILDILIVSGGDHIGGFAELLEDGSSNGVNLTYRVQKGAGGIAQALGLAKDFAAGRSVVVILGDNIFDVPIPHPKDAFPDEAVIFLKKVPDPQRFGVPQFNENGKIIKILEKPKFPPSDYAVTGLYCYPNNVFDIVPTLIPSSRGELEIADVNNWYIQNDRLQECYLTGEWFDAGTPDSLLKAAIHVALRKELDPK